MPLISWCFGKSDACVVDTRLRQKESEQSGSLVKENLPARDPGKLEH